MDLIKAQLARIQQQLGGLSASQKMLTASLVIIMIMTLFLWSRYAGTAEMLPILEQAFSDDATARITSHLSSKGIAYRVEGGKILVPSDRRQEVLVDLSYSRMLPSDTSTGFNEIFKQVTPWDSASKTDKMWNEAKQLTLSQLIRSFPDVAHAAVIIDPTQQRRFDGSIEPSATVNITTHSGLSRDKKRRLVDAAADLVAGASSGLSRSRISVIVDGLSERLQDYDDSSLTSAGGSYLELIQQHERRYVEKIREQLSFIPGALVSVTVRVETKDVQEQRHEVDPTKWVHKEVEVTSRTEESNTPAPSGADPGTGANTAAVLTVASGGGGASTNVNEERTRFDLQTSRSVQNIRDPAGRETVVAASVRVPRSFFVGIVKGSDPDGKDPTDAILQPLIDAELPKIRNDVKRCTGLRNDEDISVEIYTDAMPTLAMAAPTATGSVSVMLGSHVKEIALGVLAVVSLLMVSSMVRRGTPPPVLTAPQERVPPPHLHAGQEIAGEAGDGDHMLDGMELDEDAVKATQMLQQVQTMVKEDPDAAASLVKRWLNRA